jgi:HTH-type transcriptional regulator / antitoxin HigA
MRIRGKSQTASDSYLQCVIEFPLKAIKNERQHDQAVHHIGRLMVRENLDEGETEYVEALGRLIGEYEDRAGHRIKLPRRNPIKILKFLMNESKMTVSALGKIIGSQGVASEVLSGRRQLSKTHIRKLAQHFHVNPGLFF